MSDNSNPPPVVGALAPLVLELTPAEDLRQRISDPDGNYTPGFPPPFNVRTVDKSLPNAITFAWDYNDQGQAGFKVRTWITGVNNAWQSQGTLGPNERRFTVSEAPFSTSVGIQVSAIDSAWAEYWDVTAPDPQSRVSYGVETQ